MGEERKVENDSDDHVEDRLMDQFPPSSLLLFLNRHQGEVGESKRRRLRDDYYDQTQENVSE